MASGTRARGLDAIPSCLIERPPDREQAFTFGTLWHGHGSNQKVRLEGGTAISAVTLTAVRHVTRHCWHFPGALLSPPLCSSVGSSSPVRVPVCEYPASFFFRRASAPLCIVIGLPK